MTNGIPTSGGSLLLRDVEVDRGARTIKWLLELRRPKEPPMMLAVRSSRSGMLVDIQRLGADWGVELPATTVERISERIGEELTRANLAAALRAPERRERWAA